MGYTSTLTGLAVIPNEKRDRRLQVSLRPQVTAASISKTSQVTSRIKTVTTLPSKPTRMEPKPTSPRVVTKSIPFMRPITTKPIRAEAAYQVRIKTSAPILDKSFQDSIARERAQKGARSGFTAFRPIRPTSNVALVTPKVSDVSIPTAVAVTEYRPQIVSTFPIQDITAASTSAGQPITAAAALPDIAEQPTVEPIQATSMTPVLVIVGGLLALTLFGGGKKARVSRSK